MQKLSCLLLVVVCALPQSGVCQTNVGTISGIVYDPSGAPVPGGKVTILNPETGFSKVVSTENGGYYVFAAVPVGKYELKAEKDGFRVSEISGMTLNASSQLSID